MDAFDLFHLVLAAVFRILAKYVFPFHKTENEGIFPQCSSFFLLSRRENAFLSAICFLLLYSIVHVLLVSFMFVLCLPLPPLSLSLLSHPLTHSSFILFRICRVDFFAISLTILLCALFIEQIPSSKYPNKTDRI